jgi:hypothetical protein
MGHPARVADDQREDISIERSDSHPRGRVSPLKGLGNLLEASPHLKVWAFVCRPATRDWGIALRDLIARSQVTAQRMGANPRRTGLRAGSGAFGFRAVMRGGRGETQARPKEGRTWGTGLMADG